MDVKKTLTFDLTDETVHDTAMIIFSQLINCDIGSEINMYGVDRETGIKEHKVFIRVK